MLILNLISLTLAEVLEYLTHLDESKLDIKYFADKITNLYKDKLEEYGLGKPTMCIEPGRYIVGDAAVLLTEVNTIKKSYRIL